MLELVTVDVTFQFVMAAYERELDPALLDEKARQYMCEAFQDMSELHPAITITKFEGSDTVMDWQDSFGPYGQTDTSYNTGQILELQKRKPFEDLTQYNIADITESISVKDKINWKELKNVYKYDYVSIGGALFEFSNKGLTNHVYTVNTTNGINLACKV